MIEIDNRTIEVVGGLPEGSTVVFDYIEYTNTVIGLEGVGVEYQWNGTELGIKREDEVNYQYQDLKGEKGEEGQPGKNLEFHWNGTQLGIRVEGQSTYQYVNLKGDKGDKGDQGIQGERGLQGIQGERGLQGEQGLPGKNLEFNWNGTQLGIRQEGQSAYQYVDLKGSKGDKGDKGDTGDTGATGKSIEFNWSGTSLGVRQEGQSSYQYVNLKGDKGDTGPQGLQGPRGLQGLKGDKGDTGPAGQDGSDAEVTNANVINAIGYTPVNKAGDTISGQLGVESTTFPVVNIARNTSGTGGNLYGGARLQRKTTNPTNGVGHRILLSGS